MKTKVKKILVPVLLLVVIVLFLFAGTILSLKFQKKISSLPKARSVSFKPTTIPSLAVSPTASPSPTIIPEIRSGFCLNVPVIFYHHVEPMVQAKAEGHGNLTVDSGIFAEQMAYLSTHGYTSYSAEQLVDALISHTGLPGKPVVVTIDDGYSDVYQFAFLSAKQYGIKLSLMIPTGLLENPGYMTWGNLSEMVGSGMAFAYDHTWSHFSLPRGSYDKEESEIMTAKKQLEEHFGKPNLIFTYPYGSSNDMTISILKKNGFKGAFTTIPSSIQCDGFIYSLHRTRIGNAPLSAYGL